MYIETNTELLSFIPNVFASVKGEDPLIEKVKGYLKVSELWLNANVADHATFGQLLTDGKEDLVGQLKRIVALDAFYRAVPSLDLVLTPNGFGVVSNQNVAPASKERVANLRANLLMERDMTILQVVQALHGYEKWCESVPGKSFGSLIIQSIDVAVECGENTPSFRFWQEHRREMLGVQRMVAINFVSPKLMSRLCHDLLHAVATDNETILIDMIHAFIVSSLKEEQQQYSDLENMVNFIKKHPDEFPEWASSDTALLFEDFNFVNKKESKGFWF